MRTLLVVINTNNVVELILKSMWTKIGEFVHCAEFLHSLKVLP